MGSRARVNDPQMIGFLRGPVLYNQANIANGVYIGTIPAGARFRAVDIYVDTAQNAGTTNTVSVGFADDTNGKAPNQAAAPMTQLVNAAAAGTQGASSSAVPSPYFIAATDLAIYVSLAQTGTAATAGAVTIVIPYVPNL